MNLIQRHAKLTNAYAALTNIECYFELDFEAGIALRDQLKAAIKATKSKMDDIEAEISMLDDAADLIIDEMHRADADLPEIKNLVALARTLKQQLKTT
ncbi:MAG: hypothetical protein VXW65_03760 [Pseudomonadota bacterium]|nr:hypothetical protein [Pseudomonadota bacterium]